MFGVQMEQRVNLKFLVKLGKTFTEAYAMLKEVYGNECLSRTQRDVKRPKPDAPGRPSTSKTDENIENIFKLILEDRRLSIRGLAEITGFDKERVRQIVFALIFQHAQSLRKNGAETPHSRAKGIKNEHLR
ncbi:hypothetical protein NQ318_014881 [Aromia moschata]|uniref:RNA polymerase sigma-70 region 4 domain-containing protein n=1 Tax=Aromia moschata TaxID=1265417 RepID=A0AAV8YUK5_9CUCU|nr:hypothetical protein NQ318_014881 [Aromia moschata]